MVIVRNVGGMLSILGKHEQNSPSPALDSYNLFKSFLHTPLSSGCYMLRGSMETGRIITLYVISTGMNLLIWIVFKVARDFYIVVIKEDR